MSSPAKKSPPTSKKTLKTSKEKATISKGAFFKKNRVQILLFCAVFAVYFNAINNDYALDDEFYTAGSNKLTQQGFKGIPEIFKTRTFYNNDGSGYAYRPVALTSFAIEIQLFGEKPHTSHFINVLIYAFTIVLLYNLLRKWFKAQGNWFSFFICLLFLVHPIHTEVVANIKCRDELLAFFFSICTLHFLWKQIETGAKWAWASAAVTFTLAVLSKTSVAPFVAMTPFAVWYFTDKKWWQALIYLAPLLVAVAIVKFTLIAQVPEMSRALQGFENPIGSMEISEKTATAAYVLGRYLYLLIIPHPLIFYYGLNEVPPGSWSNPISIAAVIVYVGLAIWAWTEFRKKTIAGFGLIFFAANILLFSNLFGAAPGLMAERFAYAASLGFIIAVVDLIFRFTKKNPATLEWKGESYKKVRWIFLGVAVLFALRSIARNEAWQDKETLYRNDVAIAPESAKINMLLGSLLSAHATQKNSEAQQLMGQSQQLMMQGNQAMAQQAQLLAKVKTDSAIELYNEAKFYYTAATEIYPEYFTAWSNLGTTYYFTREYRGGIPYFKKAIAIKPDYAEAYFNLGMSYEQLSMKQGEVTDTVLLDSSIYFFSEGLIHNPKYIASAEMLGRIYFQHKHDSSKAFDVLRKSAADNPAAFEPWRSMSKIYIQSGDTAAGLAALEKAATIILAKITALTSPEYKVVNDLAVYYGQKGNAEKSGYYRSQLQQKEAEQKRRMKMIGRDR